MMMEKKKAEQKKRKRRKDIDLINDNDDAIAKMIADMRLAAREDRELNQQRMPATKKTSMLTVVMTQLRKADLQVRIAIKLHCQHTVLVVSPQNV